MDNLKVTFFRGFTNVTEQRFFKETMCRIKSGYWAVRVAPLRKMAKEGNKEEYDKLKRGLPAFTSCAQYDQKRLRDYMLFYNGLPVLDIDDLSDADLVRLKRVIVGCTYTVACFVSPSGNGLKVFVRVSTGVEDHLRTFLCLVQYFEALLGVKIDTSGKDVSRLCFVSDDKELYYNENAEVFVPYFGGKDLQTWPEAPVPVLPVLKNEESVETDKGDYPDKCDVGRPLVGLQGSNNEKGEPQGPSLHQLGGNFQSKPLTHLELVNIGKTYKRCIAYVERYHCFLEGHRNEFVYCLAMKMRKAGMTEEIVIMLLLHDYNFGEKEVRTCIKSAFGAVLKEGKSVMGSGPISKEMGTDPITADTITADSISEADRATTRVAPTPMGQEDEIFNTIDSLLAPVMAKKPGREVYDQEVIEKLLPQWYETHYNKIKGIIGWRHAHTNEPFVRMTDYDENSISRRLYHNDQIIPISQLHNLLMSDYNPVFNVFKVYKDSLVPWDGVTDYIGQLIATVKTEDDEYWDFCMRKWYVAMAVGLVVDEVINHTVIVFVGAQGLGKTSWMKRILPKEFYDYFGTAVMKTDSKDGAIQLAECAVIIIDDFDNLNKKDLASYKEMITFSDVYIRRPYGRVSEKLTRIASFIGSCNHLQILTDTTGSRRYLCSKVVSIDYQHTVDINGCMAQAYALYESGFKYWFDQEEIRELDLHNEDFMAKSVEHELIDAWLRPVTREEWKDKDKFLNGNKIQLMNAAQVMVKLMEKARITLTDNSLVKIGRVMSKAGFEKIKKNGNAYYMVRVLDSEEVDKNNRTFEVEDAELGSGPISKEMGTDPNTGDPNSGGGRSPDFGKYY